ncbi:MAG: Tat pathway signal protein [Armatimonadetes bacterium]|nr:Tat pathway signal protein [Armatimonadota bacterium]
MIWGNLLHLSYNMWNDRETPELENPNPDTFCNSKLRFDKALWDDLTLKMADSGVNMVVIDLGDGVKYKSHPELAVEGAWSIKELKDELARLRKLGIEPIPKLNFSATHDLWMGRYARMVSTQEYYKVCADLIKECIEIFDKPRLFHLGMDEETFGHQRLMEYIVIRQYDLWWKDFNFLVEQVEKNGSQAWIWSDYIWNHKDEFLNRMSKSVLQSNWYYNASMESDNPTVQNYVNSFKFLESSGYDQIPTGSNYYNPVNFVELVKWCKSNLSADRLKGFMQTPWKPTTEKYREHHYEAIEKIAEARREFER